MVSLHFIGQESPIQVAMITQLNVNFKPVANSTNSHLVRIAIKQPPYDWILYWLRDYYSLVKYSLNFLMFVVIASRRHWVKNCNLGWIGEVPLDFVVWSLVHAFANGIFWRLVISVDCSDVDHLKTVWCVKCWGGHVSAYRWRWHLAVNFVFQKHSEQNWYTRLVTAHVYCDISFTDSSTKYFAIYFCFVVVRSEK